MSWAPSALGSSLPGGRVSEVTGQVCRAVANTGVKVAAEGGQLGIRPCGEASLSPCHPSADPTGVRGVGGQGPSLWAHHVTYSPHPSERPSAHSKGSGTRYMHWGLSSSPSDNSHFPVVRGGPCLLYTLMLCTQRSPPPGGAPSLAVDDHSGNDEHQSHQEQHGHQHAHWEAPRRCGACKARHQ